MKVVKIEANTEAFKKELLKSLQQLSKEIKAGRVGTFYSIWMDEAGTVKTCKYTSLANRDAGILKQLGLLELAKNYLVEDFNG